MAKLLNMTRVIRTLQSRSSLRLIAVFVIASLFVGYGFSNANATTQSKHKNPVVKSVAFKLPASKSAPHSLIVLTPPISFSTCSSIDGGFLNYTGVAFSVYSYCQEGFGRSIWHKVSASNTDAKSTVVTLCFSSNPRISSTVIEQGSCASGYSPLSYSRNIALPEAPRLMDSPHLSSFTIRLDFDSPSLTTDSPIAYYLVKNLTLNSPAYRYFPSTSNQLILKDLSPNTAYKFLIKAGSVDGVSNLGYQSDSILTATEAPLPEVAGAVNGSQVYNIDYTGPGGGRVFYYSAKPFAEWGSACRDQCHYLEFAPFDWAKDLNTPVLPNASGLPSFPWASDTSFNSQSYGTSIGVGYANTEMMMYTSAFYRGDTSGAAYQAFNYAGNDNSRGQWFLPSQDELAALTGSSKFVSLAGDYGPALWSSTDAYRRANDPQIYTASKSAFFQDFGRLVARQYMYDKSSLLQVLPIRAF